MVNLGVEVLENVVKIVWVVIGWIGVIIFDGVFYGCIMMILVMIGKVFLYKNDFGLMFGDVFWVLFFNLIYGISD